MRGYFRHLLLERKLARTSCYAYLSGIIYFYRHICNRKVEDRFGLPPRRKTSPPTLLYPGDDLYRISHLLGHTSIRTTIIYRHIVPARYIELKIPLDFLEIEKEGSSDD